MSIFKPFTKKISACHPVTNKRQIAIVTVKPLNYKKSIVKFADEYTCSIEDLKGAFTKVGKSNKQ